VLYVRKWCCFCLLFYWRVVICDSHK